MPGIYRLRNRIQHYAWGSRTAIARLRGWATPSRRPEAELWMGSHPKAPSDVWTGGGWRPLERLPFLVKVLAAERALSIQAHPDRRQAEDGFRREEARGLRLDDPRRSYLDRNPKPELIYALEPFRMLRGFRPFAEIRRLTNAAGWTSVVPCCRSVADGAGLRELLRTLLELPADRIAALLDRTLAVADLDRPVVTCVRRLAAEYPRGDYPDDPGPLMPLLLNYLELAPGEAVFTGAGVLHAYLEGVGIELMASSDNVLRGGLTAKRRNVAELLDIVRYEPDVPRPLGGSAAGRFENREAGLSLTVLDSRSDAWLRCRRDVETVEILLCTRGSGVLDTDLGQRFRFTQGEAFLVPSSVTGFRLSGFARLMRAATA